MEPDRGPAVARDRGQIVLLRPFLSLPKTSSMAILTLSEMTSGQEGDLFALMTVKEELTTRDGKPYFKVGFRDHAREVQFPIWHDSPWGADCRETWQPGTFYKLRAVYRETNYGPQLELRKIRETCAADAADGFSPAMCQPQSRFDAERMFEELTAIARESIADLALRGLTLDLLTSNRQALLTLPAATRNHHAFVGGWLEHVLSVTRTSVFLADKYDAQYPEMRPRLNKSLVVAGAILHDIGKLREIEEQPQGAVYTAAGNLIGHILQGATSCARQPPAARSRVTCSCGWSTSSFRISGCPSGDRPNRR